MRRIPIRITPEGKVYGMFPDSMDLGSIGRVKVRRLSHVEFDHRIQRWVITSLIEPRFYGKQLAKRFKTREDALKYEVKYMEKRMSKIRKLFVA